MTADPTPNPPDEKFDDLELTNDLDKEVFIIPDPPAKSIPVAAPAPGPVPVAKLVPDIPVVQPAATPDAPKRPEVKWKELEPADAADAVPHAAADCGDILTGWQAVAASVRGRLHAHNGSYREDSYRWASSAGWGIVAVADGAGSAKLARVGSKLACEAAVTTLSARLANFHFTAQAPGATQPSTADLLSLRSILKDAADASLERLRGEARTRGVQEREFNTTLMLVILTAWNNRHAVAVLQVGDGAVGVASGEWEAGFKKLGFADHGDYSSETRFLTTPGVHLEFRNRVLFSLPAGLDALAVMTDGVADDFFPEDARLGELFHADVVPEMTAKGGGPVRGVLPTLAGSADPARDLEDWLRYERRGSSDDRTIVVLRRSPGGTQ